MKRFKGFILGALVALVLAGVGGAFAAKGVMTYLKDTAAAGGQSVVFDFLGGWNGTNCAPFLVGSNATARTKTTGNSSAVGYDGVTFFGWCSFSSGTPTMSYAYFNGSSGTGTLTTVTAAVLNGTNYGPFDRFLPGSR